MTIYEHIADVADQATAQRFMERIAGHLIRMARSGSSGVPRDSVRAGLRLSILRNYNIYFRMTESELLIIRIVHAARDHRRLKFD